MRQVPHQPAPGSCQGPDVILVGEMRNLEEVEAGIPPAQRGILRTSDGWEAVG
jgi:hypothetical protein